MKHSLSIIGLLFALVGMLAGTALAGPQYAFLCDPDDCRGSALVFEIPTSGRDILKSWAVEVEGLLPPAIYFFFNRDSGDAACTVGEGFRVFLKADSTNGKAAWSDLRLEEVQDTVDVCNTSEDPYLQILTGTLRKGGKPRRH